MNQKCFYQNLFLYKQKQPPRLFFGGQLILVIRFCYRLLWLEKSNNIPGREFCLFSVQNVNLIFFYFFFFVDRF